MENITTTTIFSTESFDIYEVFENSTANWTDNHVDQVLTTNIHGVLWPAIFTGLIIVANVVSLVAFSVERRLRTYNNYFIISLTLLDLMTGIFLILTVIHTYIGYYPFSHNACKVLIGVRAGVLNASNFIVVVICADRHRATYDPINHYMSRSKQRAVIANAIAVLVSLTFWVSYTTVVEFLIDFDNGQHCQQWYSSNPFSYMITAVALFYVPFFIIAVLYFRIAVKIQETLGGKGVEKEFALRDKKVIVEFPKPDESCTVSTVTINVDFGASAADITDKNVNKMTTKKAVKWESATEMRKATRTLLFIVVAFVISWLPQSIIMLTYSIDPSLVVPGLPRPAWLFFGWMTYMNSLLNPISYAVSQPLIRTTIGNMFRCRRQ